MSGGKGFKGHTTMNALISLAASSTTSAHSNSSSSDETHVSQILYQPNLVSHFSEYALSKVEAFSCCVHLSWQVSQSLSVLIMSLALSHDF